MSAGDLALYGAAALGAAEYVGVTDFFGGDEQGTLGDGGLPPGIAAALAAAGGRGGGAAGDALDLVVESGRQVPTGTGANAGTIADQVVENINDATSGGGGGGGPTDVPTGGNGRTGGNGVNTSGDDFKLVDLAGTNRLGTGIATVAKGADNAGSLFGEAGEFVSQNPYATGGAALGLLAAPFTGGASVPVAAAAAGGTAEIGADLITGQRGNPLEGGLDPVDSAISGTKETVAGGLTGDADTSVVGGGITGDPDTSVFGGDSSSSTSNQTSTKDERTEAARDQDSGGGGIGPEIGGVPAIGPALTGGSSSDNNDDSGIVGGGLTGDEDTSVVGGGITGDPDTSVFGSSSSSSSDVPTSSDDGGGRGIVGFGGRGPPSRGGGSGTDEAAESEKKEDTGGFGGITGDEDTSVVDGGITGDPDTSVFGGSSSSSDDDKEEDKSSSSGPTGLDLGGLTGQMP